MAIYFATKINFFLLNKKKKNETSRFTFQTNECFCVVRAADDRKKEKRKNVKRRKLA